MATARSRLAEPSAPIDVATRRLAERLRRVPVAVWVVGFILLILPAFANSFILVQIFGWSLILGMIALSLMFLAGYGGMVSLVQMTVAGCAGYMVAIFGTSAITEISLAWPWWLAVPTAILIATLFGTLSAARSRSAPPASTRS